MLREIGLFGALAPSFLLYFIASVVLFVVVDRVLRRLAFYRLTWHPALARFGLFLCLFAALVFSTQ
jgi:protein AaeX